MNMLSAEVLDRFQDLPATYAFHDVRSVWILCIEELNHVGDQMPCTAGNNRSSKRSKFTLAKYFKVVEMAGFYWLQRTQQFSTLWNMLQEKSKWCTLHHLALSKTWSFIHLFHKVGCCFSLPAGMLPDGMQGIIRKATRYLSTFSTGAKEGDLNLKMHRVDKCLLPKFSDSQKWTQQHYRNTRANLSVQNMIWPQKCSYQWRMFNI